MFLRESGCGRAWTRRVSQTPSQWSRQCVIGRPRDPLRLASQIRWANSCCDVHVGVRFDSHCGYRRRLAAEEALRPWAEGGWTPIVGLTGQFQNDEP